MKYRQYVSSAMSMDDFEQFRNDINDPKMFKYLNDLKTFEWEGFLEPSTQFLVRQHKDMFDIKVDASESNLVEILKETVVETDDCFDVVMTEKQSSLYATLYMDRLRESGKVIYSMKWSGYVHTDSEGNEMVLMTVPSEQLDLLEKIEKNN